MRELSASHLSPIQCFPDFALGEQERQLNYMIICLLSQFPTYFLVW